MKKKKKKKTARHDIKEPNEPGLNEVEKNKQ